MGDERALKNAVDSILDGDGEFLDTMYGFQSRLHNEVWLERVTSQGRYVFDAVQLRKHIFNIAGIE